MTIAIMRIIRLRGLICYSNAMLEIYFWHKTASKIIYLAGFSSSADPEMASYREESLCATDRQLIAHSLIRESHPSLRKSSSPHLPTKRVRISQIEMFISVCLFGCLCSGLPCTLCGCGVVVQLLHLHRRKDIRAQQIAPFVN